LSLGVMAAAAAAAAAVVVAVVHGFGQIHPLPDHPQLA